MATPMSASLRASVSLTPSPVMATACPRACSACTMARFWCGVTRPNTAWSSSTRPGPPGRPAGRGRRPDRRRRGTPQPGPHGAHRVRAVAGDDLDAPRPARRSRRTVSGAAARSRSSSTTRAAGVRVGRAAASPSGRSGARASSRTRRPVAGQPGGLGLQPAGRAAWPAGCRARRAASAAGRSKRPRSTCGPTRTGRGGHRPSPAAGQAVARSRPGSRCGPASSGERRQRRPRAGGPLVERLDRAERDLPSVSVPVLSRQITSTRARPSMAASSWVSTRRRARRAPPPRRPRWSAAPGPRDHGDQRRPPRPVRAWRHVSRACSRLASEITGRRDDGPAT